MNVFKTLLVSTAASFVLSSGAFANTTDTSAQAYEAKAAAATSKAATHEAMARAYRTGGTPKSSGAAMTSHCNRLIAGYRAEAADWQAKADAARQAGDQAR